MNVATAQSREQGAPARAPRTDVLTLGFGTTVAMWAVGYVSRIPPAVVPSPVVLFLLLACQIGGGYLAGRWTRRGWRGGLLTGLVSSLLNLLILGSLLSGDRPNSIHASAVWWIPGSLLAGMALGAIGAAAGASASAARERTAEDWMHLFARVAAGATFLLVIVGGLVTSQRAGLAVVDWPNSYGYSMFLYPLARMTGGIYYEHAHRLFGSLVGLTTIALLFVVLRTDGRRWVRRLSMIALATVIAQGLLGGLRVTGRLTMSLSPDDTAPNIILAVAHGVLGQVFLAILISLAVCTSPRWIRGASPLRSAYAGTDRAMSAALLGALLIQLVLGAVQRHLAGGLIVHITMATGVFLLGLALGIRTLGLYKEPDLIHLPKLGRLLVTFLSLQILLGIGSLIARAADGRDQMPSAASVLVRTTHQAVGAVLLALCVMLVLWLRRSVTIGDVLRDLAGAGDDHAP